MSSQNIPDSWCKFEQILLYKKGDAKDPRNYRDITLMNTTLKIFTAIFANRVIDWSEERGILRECQAGFRKERGFEDNIFVFNAKIAIILGREKGKLITAFINFRRIFDSVVHAILWQKLFQMGLSSQFIRTLKKLYGEAKLKVKLGSGIVTEKIEVTQGVLQGDSFSPILFILILYDIVNFFRERGHHKIIEEMELLLFADDLILLANNVIDLQAKLESLSEHCKINSLEVNIEKTKIMILQKAGRKKRCKEFKYRTMFIWESPSVSQGCLISKQTIL